MPTAPTQFDVIMPVYNHAAYVGEAIKSVLNQRWQHWRLWVVDDGSSDGSADIVADLARGDDRIRLTVQANAGPSAARNRGIAQGSAAWLAFLDSDDLYYPDALSNFAAFIASAPTAQFVHGYRDRLDSDGSITKLPGQYQDRPTGAVELFGRMYLSHLCVAYRRELYNRAGGYDEALRSVEDYDLYLRMSRYADFCPLGKATGLRRRHGRNLSRQSGYSRLLEATVLERFLANGGAELVSEDVARPRLARLHYSSGRQYFKQLCFRQAAQAFARSLTYCGSVRVSAMHLAAGVLAPLGRFDNRRPPIAGAPGSSSGA